MLVKFQLDNEIKSGHFVSIWPEIKNHYKLNVVTR